MPIFPRYHTFCWSSNKLIIYFPVCFKKYHVYFWTTLYSRCIIYKVPILQSPMDTGKYKNLGTLLYSVHVRHKSVNNYSIPVMSCCGRTSSLSVTRQRQVTLLSGWMLMCRWWWRPEMKLIHKQYRIKKQLKSHLDQFFFPLCLFGIA